MDATNSICFRKNNLTKILFYEHSVKHIEEDYEAVDRDTDYPDVRQRKIT